MSSTRHVKRDLGRAHLADVRRDGLAQQRGEGDQLRRDAAERRQMHDGLHAHRLVVVRQAEQPTQHLAREHLGVADARDELLQRSNRSSSMFRPASSHSTRRRRRHTAAPAAAWHTPVRRRAYPDRVDEVGRTHLLGSQVAVVLVAAQRHGEVLKLLDEAPNSSPHSCSLSSSRRSARDERIHLALDRHVFAVHASAAQKHLGGASRSTAAICCDSALKCAIEWRIWHTPTIASGTMPDRLSWMSWFVSTIVLIRSLLTAMRRKKSRQLTASASASKYAPQAGRCAPSRGATRPAPPAAVRAPDRSSWPGS